MAALTSRVDLNVEGHKLTARVDRSDGLTAGIDKSVAWVLSAIFALAAIVSLIVALR